MSHQSSAALLALHAVRVTGMASTERAAARYGLPRAETHELLEDDRARGYVPVSYTHLDVYKRQAQATAWQSRSTRAWS